MQKYPNAALGIKTMFMGEMIVLISIVASIILGLFVSDSITEGISSAIATFAIIVQIFGLTYALKDAKGYKTAFYLLFANVILRALVSILSLFFTDASLSIVSAVIDLVRSIIDILILFYVLRTTRELLTNVGDTKTARLSKTVWWLNVAVLIIAAAVVILFIAGMFGSLTLITLSGAAVLADGIVAIIAAILYLVFLYRAHRALA